MDYHNLWFKAPQLNRVKKILPLSRSILQPKSQNWSRKFRAEKNWVNKNSDKKRGKTTRSEIFEIENITENQKWSIKFGAQKYWSLNLLKLKLIGAQTYWSLNLLELIHI